MLSCSSVLLMALTFETQPSNLSFKPSICDIVSTRLATQLTDTSWATWSMLPSIKCKASAFMSRNSTPSMLSLVRAAMVDRGIRRCSGGRSLIWLIRQLMVTFSRSRRSFSTKAGCAFRTAACLLHSAS
eukprot:GHRR01025750.1.p1 GENE.GHRR01025750.1~~GHRR01025750.1.p1  ORF type:complete len:129 (-),score=21.51 GHRR01025750.1:479-865(-)